MKLIFGCILFIGVIALFAYWLDRLDAMKSSSWPVVSGKLLEIKDKRVSMPIMGRFAPITMPYLRYSYKVKDQVFVAEKTAGPCLSYARLLTFKPPELSESDPIKLELLRRIRQNNPADFSKLMEMAADTINHPNYKPIQIRYEAAHPANSVPDPSVLQSDVSLWWTCIWLMGIGGLGLGAIFYHAYTVAPVDDPALSLEKALEARSRRKY